MKEDLVVKKEKGKRGAQIVKSDYGIDLIVTKVGWCWNSISVDNEIIELLRQVIEDYQKKSTRKD